MEIFGKITITLTAAFLAGFNLIYLDDPPAWVWFCLALGGLSYWLSLISNFLGGN